MKTFGFYSRGSTLRRPCHVTVCFLLRSTEHVPVGITGTGRLYSLCLLVLLVDESEETTSFLAQLSTWDKEEMNEKLQQRVNFSKRAIGKLLQAFDGMQQRYESLISLVDEKRRELLAESE